MKRALLAIGILALAASPAFAGGRGGVAVGSLVGGVVAPIGAAVSNVSVLNGISVLSNNKVPVNVQAPVNAPIAAPVTTILKGNGLLGTGLLGCGCN